MLYLVSICALICFHKVVPINYGLLLVFTFAVSIMVATVCVLTNPKVVVEAAILTGALTVGLTAYACTTKVDFTETFCSCAIFMGALFVLIFSIPLAFIMGPDARIMFATFGVILFGIYIIYDTQMIMGGKHT